MSGLTSELALGTAVGGDDTANYLTITLASALSTIDGEFSSATGHNHNGAHQGGALVFGVLNTTSITFANGATLGPFATGNQLRFQSTNVSFSGNATVDGTVTTPTLNVSGTTTLSALTVNSTLTANGTLNAQAVNASTLTTTGRIAAGTDVVVGNGTLYLGALGDTVINRVSPGVVRVPNTMYFGDASVALVRTGTIGADPHPFMVQSNGTGLWIQNDGLTFYTPTDPQPGGSQQFRTIKPSTRSAATYGGGEITMSLRLNVDGDIYAGSYVHGISFMTTSDPRLKTGMTVVPDSDCIARVRDPGVNVYTYQIAPPLPDSPTRPTATDIGFDATELAAVAPEFVGINENSEPVAVVYGQIASLLWGALRQLDARVQALEA